ncbi:MAG TPA: hypothetical protein VKX49_02930 [Bryobacteraceae bacterium]|nr:hypothetical protein [Bryobacteraceae bacterium]
MKNILNDEYLRVRSYQDWHRAGSLARFGVNGAYAFDVDLCMVTSRGETEDDDTYQELTMVEVKGRDFERPKKPPQILMLTEAKCFKDEMPSPSDYIERNDFQLASLEALAKACGVPLYLVCYKLGNETIPGIGETSSLDIVQFGTAILFPQIATAFNVHDPKQYAQRLVKQRDKFAAFNARKENKAIRAEINNLRNQMWDRWCEEFNVDHPEPWGTEAFWSSQNSRWGTVADSDPISANGNFSPRPMGSKWSRMDQSPHEQATMLPSPAKFGGHAWSSPPPTQQVGSPPTQHVTKANNPPVETRILGPQETRSLGPKETGAPANRESH